MIDWKKYAPYITPAEAMCRCGVCTIESAEKMDPDFLDIVLEIRLRADFPFTFSSLYRCANHPAEAVKPTPGTHNMGKGGDITCSNNQAFILTDIASSHPGIKAIRFQQKGDHKTRFVHIDNYDRGFKHIGSY